MVGGDFSEPMIRAARTKLRQHGVAEIDLLVADALALPFADASFDCVTSGFLLRNVADLPTALGEMHRVLRPGGRAVSLEITPMRPGPIATAFEAYFQHVVPWVGGIVSGDPIAYRYLPASVKVFPDARRLSLMFHDAGFDTVSYRLVGLGSIAIHTARRA
jgi:demethylmenaquinone methyltransferase / 2-methoxy-6-polyprenyl-1,4-benzoquinol methylase